MSFGIIMKNQRKIDLVREIVLAWYEVCPVEAKEAAQQLQRMQQNQYNKNGGYRKGQVDQYGYVKVRLPQTLFQLLRRFMPGFLDDDADVQLLCKEFPKLVPCNLDT